MGKKGSICHFSRSLTASIWGHCSQVLLFTSIRGTHWGRDNNTFRAVFSQSLGTLRPPNTAKQGKTQNEKSTHWEKPHVASEIVMSSPGQGPDT